MIGRFISPDTTEVLTAVPMALRDKNLYVYCNDNPIVYKDVEGNFPDFVFDIVSVVVGISDVVTDPMDKLNWISLGADVLCTFLPGVTGGGRIVRAVTKSDDAIDAAKAVYKAADKSSDIRKATGSYEIIYKNGTTYVGKGGYKRAINSATIHSKGNKVESINWTKASSHREAYINEYKSMCKYGGPNNRIIRNTNSHNRIWSPGRKYYYKDNGKYYNYRSMAW